MQKPHKNAVSQSEMRGNSIVPMTPFLLQENSMEKGQELIMPVCRAYMDLKQPTVRDKLDKHGKWRVDWMDGSVQTSLASRVWFPRTHMVKEKTPSSLSLTSICMPWLPPLNKVEKPVECWVFYDVKNHYCYIE